MVFLVRTRCGRFYALTISSLKFGSKAETIEIAVRHDVLDHCILEMPDASQFKICCRNNPGQLKR